MQRSDCEVDDLFQKVEARLCSEMTLLACRGQTVKWMTFSKGGDQAV